MSALPSSPLLRYAQRWSVIVTTFLVVCAICVDTLDSGIAKQPLFVLGASLVAALFIAYGVSNGRMEIPLRTINVLVGLHLILFACSALFSFDTVYTWNALALGVSCIVFFFAGSSLFQTDKDLRLLLNALEGLTLLLCTVALLQLFFGDYLPLNFHIGPDRRVSSLLGNSAFFSSYLAFVLPIHISRALHRESGTWVAVFRWAEVGIVLFTLTAAQTRSSIAGCAISLGAFVLLQSRARRTRVIVLAVATTTVCLLVYAFAVRPEVGRQLLSLYGQGRESSLSRRTYFWTAGSRAFLASPLFGNGIGSLERTAFAYRSPDYWKAGSEDVVPHAHNELVEIAVEYGSMGLILFAATFLLVIGRGVTLARKGDEWTSRISAGLTCSLVAVAVDNLANLSLRQAPIALLTWLAMGLLWSGALSGPEGKRVTVPFALPSFAGIVPLLAWVAFAIGYGKHEWNVIAADMHLLKAIRSSGESPQAGIGEYRTAVQLDPDNLLARSELTREYVTEGRWDEAVRSAADLQELSPNYPKSSLMKAFAYLRLGRYPEALESIRQELTRRSHPEGFAIEAAACGALKDTLGELGAIRALLRRDVEANTAYGYRNACQRLVDLSRTQRERQLAIALIDSLEPVVPEDRGFFEALKAQARIQH